MRKFPISPFTLVRGDQTLVALEAERSPQDPNVWGVAFSDEDGIGFIVGTMEVETPLEIQFTTVDGEHVTFRQIVESDSEAAGNHPFFPNYPLPVDVIGAIMVGTQGPVDLFAVVDGEGSVNTLALAANFQMYVRYGRAWHEANSRSLIGKTLIAIDDLEVEAYDQADEAGRQLTRDMIAPPQRSAPPVIQQTPMTEPVTASAPIVSPIIASLDDADTAIQFAAENEGARWYVGKRLRALGFEGVFPWES